MNKFKMSAFAMAVSLAFAAPAIASGMSKAQHKAAEKDITSDYKTLKAGCDPLPGNSKDICEAEAKGKERVALAELEASYKPSDKARREVRLAKANATYAVAKEKCDDLAGNAKDVCTKEAEAAHVAAKADNKAEKKIVAAQKDAASDKRDADYVVAKEKCDTLAGNPKDVCVSNAKARFGK